MIESGICPKCGSKAVTKCRKCGWAKDGSHLIIMDASDAKNGLIMALYSKDDVLEAILKCNGWEIVEVHRLAVQHPDIGFTENDVIAALDMMLEYLKADKRQKF